MPKPEETPAKKGAEEKAENAVPSEADNQVGELLKNVPLLAKLSDEDRAKLGGKVVIKDFNQGTNIITQGDEGDGFYMIRVGKVVVTLRSDVNDPATASEIAQLESGDFFGETALLSKAPRGATVTAVDKEVSCFYLERQQFEELFGKEKLNVRFAKRQAVSADTNTKRTYVSSIPANAVKLKDGATTDLILKAVEHNVLFMNLDPEHKTDIVEQMYRREVTEGTDLIVQGDMGDNLYCVEVGEFHVYVGGSKVAIRGKGTCFGELALMYNSPRAATVKAATDAVVWVVDRFTFRRIVTDLSAQKFTQYCAFLKQVALLAPLLEYERHKIAEALEEINVEAKEEIIKQNEEGDWMCIVHRGKCIATKDGKQVQEYGPGSYFGERALLKDEPRAATVTAETDAQILRLDRNAFAMLLGPLEEMMHDNIARYEQGDTVNVQAVTKKAETVDVKFEDLKVLGTLGKGSFGHVQLVKDQNDKTYALKQVSKVQIVQTGQQGHILSEKMVMEKMDHPFLVKLFATYKDRDRLYFLLEPSLGGELFSVLREKTLFDERTAMFYAGSVVLAFEYMHGMNIIYRDLKPENLLLDNSGYLKITDFGFAKDISGGRTWTLCGTPDYLAPEIVAGKGHGKGVDWWTLGVFIFEMLASFPPFYDEDPMKTYSKIMHGSLTFPSYISKEAASIVRKLLNHRPTKRLGVVKGGAKLIKKQPWFRDFSFEDLYNQKLDAPIIPKIKNPFDISNFDEYPEEAEQVPEYADDGTGWDKDF